MTDFIEETEHDLDEIEKDIEYDWAPAPSSPVRSSPGTAPQAEIRYDWHSFTPGPLPDEEIFLADEPSIYEKMPAGVHELRMEGLKPFLLKRLYLAHSQGHLGETAKHYARELGRAGVLDYWTLDGFKNLAEEANRNRHDKAAQDITHNKIRELVGKFTVERRKK